MTNVEHAKMSQQVREYFQNMHNTRKELSIRIAEVAALVDRPFAEERLAGAEHRWETVFEGRGYLSPDHKDNELDACRYSHDFWKRVVNSVGKKG